MTKLAILFLLVAGQAHAKAAFTLKSATLKNGGKVEADQVFNGFGCTGKNISPNLKWSGAPAGTKAFAVTMYDPDAPTGSGWWHWTVFNIPGTETEIALNASAEGKLPTGSIEGRTDFGKPGYGGPCPPPGKPHRYIITVYALKEPLQLDSSASGAMVGFSVNANKLAKVQLTGKFGRK